MLSKRILILVFVAAFVTLLVGCSPSPAPPIVENQAPIIKSTPGIIATVGVPYTYTVVANDQDGDALTYSLINKPSGMTISSASGLIMWTPTAEGDYAVIVNVSDGALSITQSFTIKVSAVKPELTGIVVDPRTMGLFVREKEAIKSVTAYYNDGTHADITLGDCIFVSSHPYQVLVSETGVVTAVAPPSATIFVSYTERGITKMDDVIVTVSAVTLDHIVVEPDEMTLFIGQSDFIESITAYYIDGFEENIFLGDKFCKYMSSNKDIITVDDGLITAVGEGTATVTVSYFGKADTVVATVSKPISVNQAPTASFTANPTSGVAPLEVSFNASNSSDSDGSIASYEWDFKDGDTGNGETISHTFSSIGSYNVELSVTDDKGATDSTTKDVEVISGTLVGGIISSDITWTKTNNPYIIINEDLQIAEGSSLTIKEGTTVKVGKDKMIKVVGNLKTQGTAISPVTFTSLFNSEWHGIEFINSSNSSINNTIIENAYSAIYLLKYKVYDNVEFKFEGNIFRNNWCAVHGGYRNMFFNNNTFIENDTVFGSTLASGDSNVFENNVFLNNGQVFGFGSYSYLGNIKINNNNFLNNNTVIWAPCIGYGNVDILNNWWGTTDVNTIDEYIFDGKDDVQRQIINYVPIKNSEISNIGSSISLE